MPHPAMPPTPAPSTDIKGREHAQFHSDAAFDLPPSALSQHRKSDASQKQYQSSHHAPPSPTSPRLAAASTQKKRTASQAALNPAEEHALPPPPTRSRKIIQVKPKDGAASSQPSTAAVQSTSSAKAVASAAKEPAANGKKKQSAGTSAGRKIARKTAHSLIERRRRSKMNEEFGVLKDMIPACRGQEMHKLAILQASIDYLRYLENCLADVQSGTRPSSSVASSSLPTRQQSRMDTPSEDNAAAAADSEVGEEFDATDIMAISAQHSPQHYRNDVYASSFVSPSLSATVASPAVSVQGSAYSAPHRPSISNSDLPSPSSTRFPMHERAYAPYQARSYAPSPHVHSNLQSAQPSPMLLPQSSHSSAPSEVDQEASAALLMLNASDRRTSISERKPSLAANKTTEKKSRPALRGISVKDLLSN